MSTRRKLAAAIAGLAVTASGLAASPSPVAAAPEDSDTLVFVPWACCDTAFVRNGTVSSAEYVPALDAVLEGDFSAAPGTDVFLHTYGGGPDGIIHVTPTGTGATSSFRPEVVNGYYPQAFVGDFDGNGLDDIFWYGSGPAAPDSIWLFQPDGSHETVWLSVTGFYLPFVLDSNGDGHDDVVWYGYGSDPDSMWLFGPDAGHTKRSVQVNGRYQPLVGHFGGVPDDGDQEQVIWYDNIGPDFVWTFTATGRTSRTLPNEDDAQPIVGDIAGNIASNDRDAVYWYRPGAATDAATVFGDGGGPIQVDVPQVRGTYLPVVGDFDGDGHDDIAWTRSGVAIIWHADPTILTYRQTAVDTGHPQTYPAVAHPTVNVD
jgi:hypothetical protein